MYILGSGMASRLFLLNRLHKELTVFYSRLRVTSTVVTFVRGVYILFVLLVGVGQYRTKCGQHEFQIQPAAATAASASAAFTTNTIMSDTAHNLDAKCNPVIINQFHNISCERSKLDPTIFPIERFK